MNNYIHQIDICQHLHYIYAMNTADQRTPITHAEQMRRWKQRRVEAVRLKLEEELSYAEIGRILGVSRNRVRAMFLRETLESMKPKNERRRT